MWDRTWLMVFSRQEIRFGCSTTWFLKSMASRFPSIFLLKPSLRKVICAIQRRCGEALDGIEVVFHLAAAVGVGQSMYEIAHYMGVNTQGTAVLLQELLNRTSRVEKLVLASSMSIYGEGKYLCAQCSEIAPPLRNSSQLKARQWEMVCPQCGEVLTPIPTDESKPLQCSSIYALSKKDQEEMCLLFGRTYGIPVVGLRYFNIYGPRQALSNPYTGVAAIFASRLLNGKPPLVFEDGKQMRDFVSVRDVVQANLLAIESERRRRYGVERRLRRADLH